jgi:hypothetical protein
VAGAGDDWSAPIPVGSRHERLLSRLGWARSLDVPPVIAEACALHWQALCEQRSDNPLTPEDAVGLVADIYSRYTPTQAAQIIGGGSSTLSALTVTPFGEIERERFDWRWRGYLAGGKLHLVESDPGNGKSTVMFDVAARLSTGADWPDGTPNGVAGVTLICSVEDGPADTIRPRLEYAGADLSKVFFVHRDELNPMFTIPDDLGALRDLIVATGASLVIIDPLNGFLSEKADSFNDQKVRTALTPLAVLAAQTGAAIVVIRHLRKGDGSALYRGAGSIGIAGAARFVYHVGIDPDDPDLRVFAPGKRNIGAAPPAMTFRFAAVPSDPDVATIAWAGKSNHTAEDLAASDVDKADANPISAWLVELLYGKEMFCNEVRDAAGKKHYAWRTVHRVAKRIGVTMTPQGFPARTVWALAGDPEKAGCASRASETQIGTAGIAGTTGATDSPNASDIHDLATVIHTADSLVCDIAGCDVTESVTVWEDDNVVRCRPHNPRTYRPTS